MNLIEKLRDVVNRRTDKMSLEYLIPLCQQAADEIERLKKIEEMWEYSSWDRDPGQGGC